MNWYTNTDVSFKRINEKINPVANKDIPKGTIVFYEVPVRSENHITVDIIRYTMQCVYSGELLFPCSFNTDITEKSLKNLRLKVFFDQVFNKTFRRNVTDKLATSMMDQCESPFLFKALGAFYCKDEGFNCLKVSFLNGETFLATTRDVEKGTVLESSTKNIMVPRPDNQDPEEQMEVMTRVLIEDILWYNMALDIRENALKVKPKVNVRIIDGEYDKDLEYKIAMYEAERRAGLTDVREHIVDTITCEEQQTDEQMMEMMEQEYNRLMTNTFGEEYT